MTIKNENSRTIRQIDACSFVLDYCEQQPGADITIMVKHDSGLTAILNAYDNAQLINDLRRLLANFKEELQ